VNPAPDTLFRLFGYGGLALVALLRAARDGTPSLWLLAAFAFSWPALWGWLVVRWPGLRDPRARGAQAAHAAECAMVTGLVVLSGLELWVALAVGLLCLTGVTALGGHRLLVPCAPVVGLCLVLVVREGRADGGSLAAAALTGGFLLGLAWLSFARIRRLSVHRRRVLSEAAALKDRNARLARYVPEPLPPLIGSEPAALKAPTEHFSTVAFFDVVGFVELVAARPVTELAEVLNDFMSTVVTATERRGGVVGKFLGDGVLVYFADSAGASAADRWRGACACARLCLELLPALVALERAWQRRGLSLSLGVRAGVASGFCAIGDWGGGARLDYTPIGMPVNLASRLQALAEPGSVLLTAATAALLAEDPELVGRLEPLGPRSIKGAGSVVVHRLNASAKVRAILLPAKPAGAP
jgi:class 3 adenylate cyclase